MNWIALYRPQIPFEELETLQQRCWEEVSRGSQTGYLIASEPSATFTAGKSAQAQDLLWNENDCRRHDVRVQNVTRGGQWTFHGPGQLVLYPIVRLADLGFGSRGVSAFVQQMRHVVWNTLRSLGVESEARDCPYGLFAQEKKLVSFGIAVKEGVSQHGLALYLRDQSRYFNGIRACGMDSHSNISLEQLGCAVEWDSISRQLVQNMIVSLKKNEADAALPTKRCRSKEPNLIEGVIS